MTRTAVIAGVGPGLGAALARRFDAADCSVGLFARSGTVVDDLEAELDDALAVETDLGDSDAVEAGFTAVREAFGPVDVLVLNASSAPWQGTLDISPAAFDDALDANVHGALHCVQEAVPDMLESGEGTVIFTGATTSVRGREGALGFSAAKFAARGMAESMARELGPEGIHVAHVVIDGQILPGSGPATDRDAEEYLDPDAIADEYWRLVEQDRSAWTLELDLRPHVESF
jgi:NAD(P)-dependent dehydrogenase (short-subunit alcohol dehydrogenase family)